MSYGEDIERQNLQNLDDETLFKVCLSNKSANRVCSYEPFWYNRFIQKYGEREFHRAKTYKSPQKTWRKFYLQTVQYWNEANGDVDNAMLLAAQGGHRDLVDFFIFKGANRWNYGLLGAARGGHRDLVDFFVSKGANDWDAGMEGAARGGHRDLVDFFVSKGANSWNAGMANAEKGGHRGLVDFFVSKGAF